MGSDLTGRLMAAAVIPATSGSVAFEARRLLHRTPDLLFRIRRNRRPARPPGDHRRAGGRCPPVWHARRQDDVVLALACRVQSKVLSGVDSLAFHRPDVWRDPVAILRYRRKLAPPTPGALRRRHAGHTGLALNERGCGLPPRRDRNDKKKVGDEVARGVIAMASSATSATLAWRLPVGCFFSSRRPTSWAFSTGGVLDPNRKNRRPGRSPSATCAASPTTTTLRLMSSPPAVRRSPHRVRERPLPTPPTTSPVPGVAVGDGRRRLPETVSSRRPPARQRLSAMARSPRSVPRTTSGNAGAGLFPVIPRLPAGWRWQGGCPQRRGSAGSSSATWRALVLEWRLCRSTTRCIRCPGPATSTARLPASRPAITGAHPRHP